MIDRLVNVKSKLNSCKQNYSFFSVNSNLITRIGADFPNYLICRGHFLKGYLAHKTNNLYIFEINISKLKKRFDRKLTNFLIKLDRYD